jgi:purine-nucleoside phosphorylase
LEGLSNACSDDRTVTNAAGGLNQNYRVGDIVCLNDHLNMAGLVGIHPLRGPNIEEFGVRFPPLSDAYDLDLRRRTHKAWVKLGLDQQKRRLHEGVYAFVAGPTYVIDIPSFSYFATSSIRY